MNTRDRIRDRIERYERERWGAVATAFVAMALGLFLLYTVLTALFALTEL